jgi:2-polyprenyl-6-methoxyphenol hydroxylase-like FAD-dependent oxidoreductase
MTAGLEDAVALAQQLGALAAEASDGAGAGAGVGVGSAGAAWPEGGGAADPEGTACCGVETALHRYNAERLPVVHGYQERSRQVSARTGRIRRPQVAAEQGPGATGPGMTPFSAAGPAQAPAAA